MILAVYYQQVELVFTDMQEDSKALLIQAYAP
jgi:hypothetical protein